MEILAPTELRQFPLAMFSPSIPPAVHTSLLLLQDMEQLLPAESILQPQAVDSQALMELETSPIQELDHQATPVVQHMELLPLQLEPLDRPTEPTTELFLDLAELALLEQTTAQPLEPITELEPPASIMELEPLAAASELELQEAVLTVLHLLEQDTQQVEHLVKAEPLPHTLQHLETSGPPELSEHLEALPAVPLELEQLERPEQPEQLDQPHTVPTTPTTVPRSE